MMVLLRLALSAALVAVFCFCVFGFLASGEAPPGLAWGPQTIYAMIAALCVLGTVGTWLEPRRMLTTSVPSRTGCGTGSNQTV